MKNKWKKIMLIVFSIMILAALSLTASVLKNSIEDNQRNDLEPDIVEYGQDGKIDGSLLDSEPIRISDEYVYYQDRIVKRFYFKDEEMDKYALIVSDILEYFPDNIEKNFMLIPPRIVFEDIENTDDRDNFIKTYEEISGHLGDKIKVLDTYSLLDEYKDKYIFFRTDETWTALGAYYAARQYIKLKGIEMYPLENYKENRFTGYVGTMWAAEGAEYIFDSPDYVSYYMLDDIKNKQKITAYENGEYLEFESPVLAVSRMGTDIFMGGIFSHSIIQGDGNNAEYLMIIGDKNAKIFAPWMIPYYDRICVVDPAYFEGGHDEFENLIEENKITEVLFMTNMNTLDHDVRMDRIKYLTESVEQDETEEE